MYHNPLQLHWQHGSDKPGRYGRLYGSAMGLALVQAARQSGCLTLAITAETPAAVKLEQELHFYSGDESGLPILTFPDWETLPYDSFSPHQDIISERLLTLHRLTGLHSGILVVPMATLLQRLPPRRYLEGNSFLLDIRDRFDLDATRTRLTTIGYRNVSQVMEHGEFAVRGSIIDLYPMGSKLPYRIELFDDEVESIRTFDPDSQRSIDKVESIRLLPAREFPFDEAAIKNFRQRYRAKIAGDPNRSTIYREVSNGFAPPGIEYYLPLFYDDTQTLFDYLPSECLIAVIEDSEPSAAQFLQEVAQRYEQLRHDVQRPLLPPEELYLGAAELEERLLSRRRLHLQRFEIEGAEVGNIATQIPPQLTIEARAAEPLGRLQRFIREFNGRILFAAESSGRRETLLDILHGAGMKPALMESWPAFLASDERIAITVAPLADGLVLEAEKIAVITEPQLFGQQVLQQRRRAKRSRDADQVVRNLVELHAGDPVVHEEHGVGRYLGLQKITVGPFEQEFLALEYAGGDKLYVPVASLHLISRFTGAEPEHAPLHRLGSGQWEKAKRKARERVRDVAAELLDIYARRAARKGHIYHIENEPYQAFAASFPFEETPDQQEAIAGVLADMASDKPMDRLVCGDVGFGKTEVAMRAAFVAVQDGKQVAMLVPTTLLAQQHYQNFRDRFADWPVQIESLSRFRSAKEQVKVLHDLQEGTLDIVIGTHKLLQKDIRFKRLGLVIIDEEHRFGVRQKERFKALRSEVDVLTLTATPIPRTLNLSLSGLRDLSVIATPPAKRLAVRTFITQWNDTLVQEACLREIHRGGQVYFVHNEVQNIDKLAADLQKLVPAASIRIAHGQMRERELEQVMADFYHQRFNILMCTTIIETGIDVPNANTIIINKADHFGLAQLYQLRGRVGRSHHQAYAYLVTPPQGAMTADAVKRLEAIDSIEELGAGFTLATHDLEIRGAGELLGDEQSGQIQEIGFGMYMDLLDRAVEAMKAGREPALDEPLSSAIEIDLGIPALIPDDYLPDVHSRLILYKRIANAATEDELTELQVEMIDRFGLLPEPVKNLFQLTALKLRAMPIGIRKIECNDAGGRLAFGESPDIDPLRIINLVQKQSTMYTFDGKDRLRLVQELPDARARLEAMNRLLDTLTE